MNKQKEKIHYVNNKEFYESIRIYINQCRVAEQTNTETPKVTEYLGECFFKIAQRIATKPNFANYTFKEDMVLDGVENCLRYILNFNPDKSKNPFSYFTTVITYSFIRRIEKEKKYTYVKLKAMENELHKHDSIGNLNSFDSSNFSVDGENMYDNFFQFIKDYEENKKTKNEKKKKPKNKKMNDLKFFFVDDE